MNVIPPPLPVGTDARAAALERIFALLRLVAVVAAVALALWLLSEILVLVFAAALLAVILHGTASLLRRVTRLPHWAALAIVVLLIVVLLGGLGYAAGPGLVEQADLLRKALLQQTQGLQGKLQGNEFGRMLLQQLPPALGGSGSGGGGIPTGLPGSIAGSVAGALGSAFGLLGTLVVILIAGIYLAASPHLYVNGFLRLMPVASRHRARELCVVAGDALWAWTAGQALDMLVVGVLSGVGLMLLGVPLALVLGVVAGLMNFVPYIGATIGAIPAIIIAFSAGATTGLETMALYAVIQGFEGNVMAPMIQNRAVHMPPGLTILSQAALGVILGISGLIFATPLTAAILAVAARATVPVGQEDQV